MMMADLKIHTQGTTRIENVITANERMKNKLRRKNKEIRHLRNILLNPISAVTSTTEKIVVSSEEDCSPRGQHKKFGYSRKLQKALARNNQLLEDKFFDMK